MKPPIDASTSVHIKLARDLIALVLRLSWIVMVM
jgi:hypothetical protein